MHGLLLDLDAIADGADKLQRGRAVDGKHNIDACLVGLSFSTKVFGRLQARLRIAESTAPPNIHVYQP